MPVWQRMGGTDGGDGWGGWKCQANMIQAASGGNERLQRSLSHICTGNLSRNEAEPNKPRRRARSRCHLPVVVEGAQPGWLLLFAW